MKNLFYSLFFLLDYLLIILCEPTEFWEPGSSFIKQEIIYSIKIQANYYLYFKTNLVSLQSNISNYFSPASITVVAAGIPAHIAVTVILPF